MGRPEKPLGRDGSPVRELAYWLRDLRNQSGLTYDQLARRAGFSTSTLQEALAGRRSPTLPVTLAIVEACGGDVKEWRTYWAQIRRARDPDSYPGSDLPMIPSWAVTDAPAARKTADSTWTGNEETGEPHAASPKISPLRHRWRWAIIGGGVLAVALDVIITVLLTSSAPQSSADFSSPYAHPTAPPIRLATKTYIEQEFNPNGAPTFQFLNGSGAGIPVSYGQYVQISCKVFSTIVKSTVPDGYWYRLASMPWDNHYYVVANTFGNGDKLSGPYTHNTDWKVPNC